MADRYGGRDSGRYGGRDYGRYGSREEEDAERRGRYRQGLDYRGPYDVISRQTRGGHGPGRDYGEDSYGGRDDRSDYGRDDGRGYARGFERDDDRDETRYGRERYYGGPTGARGPAYARDYASHYGRGDERVYGRGYDYVGDEREYRRDEERGGGRGAQTDYGRTSSRFFGRGGGEYEARYGRGYDYRGDEERGGRGYDDDDEERGGGRSRGLLDRVSDEVASWFGDREAVRRRRLDEKRARRRGRGPKNYRRSDERIREDINDRLSDQDYLDASEIEVGVSGGEVTLSGTVETRYDKRLAEDIAESVSGVTHVQNNLRVEYRGGTTERTDETTVVSTRPGTTTGMTNDVTLNTTPGVMNDATTRITTGATDDATSDASDIGGASSSAASGGGGR